MRICFGNLNLCVENLSCIQKFRPPTSSDAHIVDVYSGGQTSVAPLWDQIILAHPFATTVHLEVLDVMTLQPVDC